MTKQNFKTLDHVRLEVEVAPVGLTNIVANPDGVLGGWGWLTPAANSRMTGSLVGGLTYYAPIPKAASWFTTEPMPMTPGHYAAASWRALAVPGTGSVYNPRFDWLNASGALISQSPQGGTFATGTLGVLAYAPQQAPAGTAYVRLRFDTYGTGSVGAQPEAEAQVRLTDVKVATATTAAALGSSRTNLISNPGWEIDGRDWTANPGSVLGRTTTLSYAGTAAMYVGLAFQPAIPHYPAAYAQAPVAAGRDYTFQFQIRSDAPRTARAEIYWLDAQGKLIPNRWTSRSSASPTSTTAWTRHWVTATAPSGAVTARVFAGATTQTSELHYIDAMMLTEGRDLPDYFDGSTPAAGTRTYAWTSIHSASTSTLTDSTLGSLVPTNWRNIMGPTHSIELERQGLDLGTLDAEILDPALDPAQTNQLRPGRRVRLLVAQPDATWEPLFTGKADTLDVTYDEKGQTPKPPRITLNAVDPTTSLTTARRSQGVATVDELPAILEGAGVPWNVNGSGNQVATYVVVSENDNASALDQVAISRDTALGAAWVDRRGVLRVEDRAELSPSPFPLGGTFDDPASVDGNGYVFGRAPLYSTAARVTSPVRSGSGALRLTATSQTDLWNYMGVQTQSGTPGMPVVGGRTYTARMWTRAATTPRAARLLGYGYKWNTLVQAMPSADLVMNTTTGWTEHTLTFTAAPGTKTVGFTLMIEGDIPTGEVHYIDDFRLDLHRRNALVLDEATYSDLDLTFSSRDLINSVSVKLLRRAADGTTEEVPFGPYDDAASVREWGRRSATYTVHGLDSSQIPAYAAKILARNAVPKVRVNGLTMPMRSVADLSTRALLDLYDEPSIVNAGKSVNQVLQVSRVRHTIEPEKWLVEASFADAESVASPQQSPYLAPMQADPRTAVPLTNGWTGSAFYQRSGDVVTVSVEGIKLAGWNVNDNMTAAGAIPATHRPAGLVMAYAVSAYTDNTMRNFWIGNDGVIHAGSGGTGSIYGACTFVV